MTKFKNAKFRLTLGLMLLLLIVFVSGCGTKDTAKAGKATLGELAYTKIDLNTIAQLPPEIRKWYEEKYKTPALHSYSLNGERYLLLSAGEKRTGGYEIRDLKLTGKDNEIEVKASLKSPAQDEIVSMALTYPHVLIKIPEDGRKLIYSGIADGQRELKTDSGRYTGQIDNNSIEIKISGTPDKVDARAFQLGAEIKEKFAALDLKTNEDIKFKYYVDQYGRSVITEIEPLSR